MSSSPFQVTGVASGIEWDSIIESMIKTSRKPAEQWQTQIDRLELKKTLYEEITSKVYSLRSTITSLKLPSAYKKKAAEFVVREPVGQAGENIVKATVNADAEIAAWDIEVKQLAKSERVISSQFNPGDSLNLEGRIRIQVGVQVAFLDIEKSDSIRTINQKLNNLTDADGGAVAVTAKLIDNRLVIEGALTGCDTEGPLAEAKLEMHDSLYEEVTVGGKKVKQYKTYLARPAEFDPSDVDEGGNPKQANGSFPPQIFSLRSGSNYYREGTDFEYDSENGVITWLSSGQRPSDGEEITAVFQAELGDLTSGSANAKFADLKDQTLGIGAQTKITGIDTMPELSTGQLYKNLPTEFDPDPAKWQQVGDLKVQTTDPNDEALKNAYKIYDKDTGKLLEYGKDYEFALVEDSKGQKSQVILWHSNQPAKYDMICGADNDYIVNNRQMHLIEEGATAGTRNSLLAKLGFTDIDESTFEIKKWNNRVYAQDAKLTLNGVDVTRPTNTIPVEDDWSDALIANVKLELTGIGKLTMNITQDASDVIEKLQEFTDAYNDLLELINYRLEEKADKQGNDDNDVLSSIISESRGDTSFGLLHGDTLLWSIKNQMRTFMSNPITSLSSDLRTKKFLHPASALSMTGSFYINVGGMVSRINVEPADSLVDIQRKLNNATAISSNTQDGKSASGKELGLNVTIEDGQLIIKRASNITGTGNENHTITRSANQMYDYLPFVPNTADPIGGVLTITSGSTTYTEGVDYELDQFENEKGVYESRIKWLDTGNRPNDGRTYSVSYEYQAGAVGYEMIGGAGVINDLSALDLHYDSGKSQLSNFGLSTTSDDYGKSGLIEFDQEKFFEQLREDSDLVSNVMRTFMTEMDTYIGNLVDSSNVVIGGNIVTKGRFAAALNSIDSEISTLNERITNLERQLEEKQNALYKQYSDMETSIQTMNAQMSSIANFLSSSSGNSSS